MSSLIEERDRTSSQEQSNRDSCLFNRNRGKFPKHGWMVKLDHKFPEQRDQNLRPSLKQIVPQLVPLGLRYTRFWLSKVRAKKKPFIDQYRPRHSKMMYGAPCGGLGCGTIGRGFRGEFCRFQMTPGIYEYNTVPFNQFILTVHTIEGELVYQSVLGGGKEPIKGAPQAFQWLGKPEDGLYCALYPRAWTVYNIPQIGVRVICRQISPFIPGNYKDSSLPASVFVFTVDNNKDKDYQVSITFTMKNGTGNAAADRKGGVWTQPFKRDHCRGVLIHQRSTRGDLPLTYAVGANTSLDRTLVTWMSAVDPKSNCSQLWERLREGGTLTEEETSTQPTGPGQEIGVAVTARTMVDSQSASNLEFSLVWDNPEICFRDEAKNYQRYYTRYFEAGPDGRGADIVNYALKNWPSWEESIELWQAPVLSDPDLPDWFKSAVFNELYYLADSGSVWVEIDARENIPEDDLRRKYGRWGYLESHEYRMYNTYDVHYYASWAMIDLFPGIQLSLQLDFLDSAVKEDKEIVLNLYDGKRAERKVKNSVPHDLGDPEEEPWLKVNSYKIHDVSEWRDLNLKLVLQVWRDVIMLRKHSQKESEYLLSCSLPTCLKVMETAKAWDKDGDGLIENSGWPDQTFDSWVMSGASAYCGGLWLASLACIIDLCEWSMEDSSQWQELLTRADAAYSKKLWNGNFFNFDESAKGSNVIMADQMAGYWYRKLASFYSSEEKGSSSTWTLERSKVLTTLRTVFDNNVLKFSQGAMGAVNGMLTSGAIDKTTVQSEEMWTGVSYGLASLMIAEGLTSEGFTTAEGVYRTVYETIGLGFETPEALYEKKHYRAIGYMRPLSCWAIYMAWNKHKSSAGEKPID